MNAILKHCAHSGQSFWEYVEAQEGPEIWDFLREVWQAMQAAIERGSAGRRRIAWRTGTDPKGVGVLSPDLRQRQEFSQRRFTARLRPGGAEENASGGIVVTAPTCGSCGIVPAVLRHVQENTNCSDTPSYAPLPQPGSSATLSSRMDPYLGRGGLPGRGGRGMRHGGGCCSTASGRYSAPGGICRRNGPGTPPWS